MVLGVELLACLEEEEEVVVEVEKTSLVYWDWQLLEVEKKEVEEELYLEENYAILTALSSIKKNFQIYQCLNLFFHFLLFFLCNLALLDKLLLMTTTFIIINLQLIITRLQVSDLLR